jgi:hypothetical protein
MITDRYMSIGEVHSSPEFEQIWNAYPKMLRADVRRLVLPATLAVSLAVLGSSSTPAAPAQGRRVVDVVTLGDARSEREHDYDGERVTEGVVDGRVFRQTEGWLRVSLAVYEDTEVTLVGTFRGSAGESLGFELLVEGQRVNVPAFVSPSTAPARVEYRVPLALTKGKTRLSITLRAVNGPTPGLLEWRTVQEHLELCPSIHTLVDERVPSGRRVERARQPDRERAQPLSRVEALR